MDKYNLCIKNKKTLKLVKAILYISYLTCIIGLLLLNSFNINCKFILFRSGIIVFRTGLFMGVFSIIFGIFFDNYLE